METPTTELIKISRRNPSTNSLAVSQEVAAAVKRVEAAVKRVEAAIKRVEAAGKEAGPWILH